MEVELLQGRDLLRRGVPAVVDEDVDARHGLADLGEEAAVGLVADENGGRRVLELLAPRVDVDADDAGAGAEVLMPHLQRSALEHADFDHDGRLAAEPLEMPVIDLEVVVPLVDEPVRVAEEVVGEGIRRSARHGRPCGGVSATAATGRSAARTGARPARSSAARRAAAE